LLTDYISKVFDVFDLPLLVLAFVKMSLKKKLLQLAVVSTAATTTTNLYTVGVPYVTRSTSPRSLIDASKQLVSDKSPTPALRRWMLTNSCFKRNFINYYADRLLPGR